MGNLCISLQFCGKPKTTLKVINTHIHTHVRACTHRNELLGHGNPWRNLQWIWITETSQHEKNAYWMFSTLWHAEEVNG